MKKLAFLFVGIFIFLFSPKVNAQDTVPITIVDYLVNLRPYNQTQDIVWAHAAINNFEFAGIGLWDKGGNIIFMYKEAGWGFSFFDYKILGNNLFWIARKDGFSFIYHVNLMDLTSVDLHSALDLVSDMISFSILPNLEIYLFYVDSDQINLVRGKISDDYSSVSWYNVNEPVSLSYNGTLKAIASDVVYIGDDIQPSVVFALQNTTYNNLTFYMVDSLGYYLKDNIYNVVDSQSCSIAITSGYLDGVDTANGYIQIACTDGQKAEVFSFNPQTNSLTKSFEENLEQSNLGQIYRYTRVSFPPKFEAIDNANIQMYKTLCIPYIIYNLGGDNLGADYYQQQWLSDKLVLVNVYQQTAPVSYKDQVWDLLAVVEGPPPFALNGNSITELDDPPSIFYFGHSEQQTFTVSSTYSLSAQASFGYGPVDLSVRGYYSETHQSTVSHSINITTQITPPLDNSSSGYLVYIYSAPTIRKTVWEELKNDSSHYSPPKYVSFFSFEPPQQQILTVPLDTFEQSPNIFDLYSYLNRNVQGFPGFETLTTAQLEERIYEGISQSVDISYSVSNANQHTKGIETSLNISFGFGPFDTDLGLTAGVSYTEEHSFTITNSFSATFNNPTPVDLMDTNNVKAYTVNFYVMRVLNNDAYILPQAFYGTHPYFITYEVSNIETGAFTNVEIDDNKLVVYPNPVRNVLYLKNMTFGSFVQLFSEDGRLIKMIQVSDNQKIDVSDLNSGIYLLKVYDIQKNKFFTAKIIKQ